jgi:hypothetical protein
VGRRRATGGVGRGTGQTHPLLSKSIPITSSDAMLPAPAEAGVGAAEEALWSGALSGGCGLITAMERQRDPN